jgi:cytochrome P450
MHRTTRRIFTRALQSDLVGTNAGALREIVQRELSAFASACETRPPHNDEMLRTLDRIATAMLLLLFFGVRFGDPAFATFLSGYARLGPKEFVWAVGPAQQRAFADLTVATHALIADLQRSASGRHSPFGFDHHHCIAGDLVVQLSSILVEELVHGFCWEVLADGPCQRGPFHWGPAAAFAIRLAQC